MSAETLADHAADPARGGHQRRGLALDRREIRLLVAVGIEEILQLQYLSPAQLADRLSEEPGDVGAERGREGRRLREQEVAGEDRDDVRPAGVDAGHAAAGLGLVDHVVVVQRAEVDQLDRSGAGDGLVGSGPALRAPHRRHRGSGSAGAACLRPRAGDRPPRRGSGPRRRPASAKRVSTRARSPARGARPTSSTRLMLARSRPTSIGSTPGSASRSGRCALRLLGPGRSGPACDARSCRKAIGGTAHDVQPGTSGPSEAS